MENYGGGNKTAKSTKQTILFPKTSLVSFFHSSCLSYKSGENGAACGDGLPTCAGNHAGVNYPPTTQFTRNVQKEHDMENSHAANQVNYITKWPSLHPQTRFIRKWLQMDNASPTRLSHDLIHCSI